MLSPNGNEPADQALSLIEDVQQRTLDAGQIHQFEGYMAEFSPRSAWI